MITKKDWCEFQEYRAKRRHELYCSKEWAKITEDEMEAFKPIIRKYKFLWWSWEEEEELPPYQRSAILREAISQRNLYEDLCIPKNTLEACLDWLVKKNVSMRSPKRPIKKERGPIGH